MTYIFEGIGILDNNSSGMSDDENDKSSCMTHRQYKKDKNICCYSFIEDLNKISEVTICNETEKSSIFYQSNRLAQSLINTYFLLENRKIQLKYVKLYLKRRIFFNSMRNKHGQLF